MSAIIWSASGTASSWNPAHIALASFWDHVASATLYRTWKRHNPGELARLEQYAAGGDKPTMLTAYGRSLIDVVDVHRAVGAPNPIIP